MPPPSMHWMKQAYLAMIPALPMGYLLIHGFRGDQIWTKFYVERSRFPATEHLKEIVESELDKFSEIKNPKTLVTLTDEMEPKVYGGFFLNPGAELQFPLRVAFEDVEQARRMGANVELDLGLAKHRRKIELTSSIGDELVARLMLSDAAKRFIVQRQLQIANNGQFFCTPIFTWVGVAGVGYGLMTGMAPMIGPGPALVVAIGLAVALFRQFYLGFDEYKTKKADELAVENGEMYLIGARDYFNSSMKFNRKMRQVLGEEGEKNITKSGDLTTDRCSYSKRLKNVEAYMKARTAATDSK